MKRDLMRNKIVIVGLISALFFLGPIYASYTNTFDTKNIFQTSVSSSDIDPLVDLIINVNILRVRSMLIEEPQSFYVKVIVNQESWESEHMTGYDILDIGTASFNIPDESENIDITIEVWNEETQADIFSDTLSQTKESLYLSYNMLTGSWSGDDYINDASGYGHATGYDGENIDASDFEIWFNIGFNDYDNDGLTYWEETNVYGTDPEISNIGDDYDNDSIPIEWEDFWGYNPFEADDHTRLDPDRDGIQNVEEYTMKEWFADPFRQDIYIENDYIGANGNKVPIMPEESIQLQYTSFAKNNIMLYIDDGQMGGSDIIPYESTYDWDDFHRLYEEYFLHNDENHWRKGIFHHCLIIHTFSGFGRGVGGFNFRGDAFAIASIYVQRWRPWEQGSIIGHGGTYMHELGHQLGLDHLQVFPWQPTYWLSGNYKSCMNYRYNFKIVDYSHGEGGYLDRDEWGTLNLQRFQRQ